MIWLWFINGVFREGLQGFMAKFLKKAQSSDRSQAPLQISEVIVVVTANDALSPPFTKGRVREGLLR